MSFQHSSIRLIISTLLVIFNLVHNLEAQSSGWELVKSNNFAEAKTAFENELKNEPKNEAAIVGQIFIAETLHDYENYSLRANQLISTGNPDYVWLFRQMSNSSPEELLKMGLPEPLRSQLLANQADTLFVNRRFDERMVMVRSIFNDLEWAITGPFTNVAGSGFLEKTPVETEPFDISQTFKNENDVEFGWFKRQIRNPSQGVDFDDLPGGTGMSTFYANTFLSFPSDQKVKIGIRRHEPIKIWLDDQLLLERPRQTAQLFDLETITLEIPAGYHRLLVKISEFPDAETNSKVALCFNEVYDDGDDLGNSNYGGRGFSEGGGSYRRYSDESFQLRFTDVSGRFLPLSSQHNPANYAPAKTPWRVDFQENARLKNFKSLAEAKPGELWRQYLLAKAFSKSEAYEEGEEYFFMALEKQKASSFLAFLLAKFYDANDKGDKAEALLSGLDTVTCPTFAEHFLRLGKIDKEQNEAEYLTMLEHILAFSPTNWGILSQYLEHLKEKGKKEQVKGYVKKFLENHKEEKWKTRLEDYLKEESYKPESTKPRTDKEREKEFKEAKKRLKKRVSMLDYNTIIEFYKSKDKVSDVLRTYDELLGIMPWNTFRRYQKARYLFENERLDDALKLLFDLQSLRPYDSDVFETIGDIYVEQKIETEALKYYRKAEKLSRAKWGGGDLAEKIEKIENERKFTGYFQSINLSEVAKDVSWKEKYRDEESVISFYAQQAVFKKEKGTMETSRKMVIHILNEAGARFWTEGDFRNFGRITSAKILKKDGTITSPDMSYDMAVFKNLQPGDIILVEGSGMQGMPDEIPGELLNIDVLSWQAPVAKSTLELLAPKEMELYFSCNRIDCQYITRDTGEFKMLTWVWRDIEKMQREEATPDNMDEYAYINMGSVKDWSRVVEWYNRKTYCRPDENYELRQKARELVKPGMTKAEIVEVFHNFITKDINYSYVPFLNSNYTPKRATATLSGKVGDCKDVATLMISLLREQGIPAWYVLVETHGFSRQTPRPTLYVFNHAIVAYEISPGETLFADLTTDHYPNGIVPEFDSDSWALIVREGEKQAIRLPNHALNPEKSRIEIKATAIVDADENISLTVETSNLGCPAGRWREQLIPATPEDRRKKLSEYFGGGVLTHLDFESVEFQNLDNQNDALRYDLKMKAFNQLDKVSNFWIMPLPLPLSTPTHKTLFAAKRYNDLDADELFELTPVRETVDLTLPPGFSLLEMPADQKISSAFGEYSLKFEAISGGGIRIFREVTFRQRFVNHVDYQAFKSFYLKMLDADDAKLALRKG